MESQSKFRPDPKLKLMDQLREVLRYYHYAYRTEQTDCQWYQNLGLRPTQTNHGERFRAQAPGKGVEELHPECQFLIPHQPLTVLYTYISPGFHPLMQ